MKKRIEEARKTRKEAKDINQDRSRSKLFSNFFSRFGKIAKTFKCLKKRKRKKPTRSFSCFLENDQS